MNNQGFFDARNGAAYAADQAIPYAAGQTYQVRLDLDVPGQTYDVAVDGVTLATGYAFRLPTTSLGQAIAWHASGGVTATGLTVTGDRAAPDLACAPDAGLPDGGGDAGAPAPDASMPTDGSVPGADGGGNPPDSVGNGCGCAAGGAGDPLVSVLLLLGLVGVRWRRARLGW